MQLRREYSLEITIFREILSNSILNDKFHSFLVGFTKEKWAHIWNPNFINLKSDFHETYYSELEIRATFRSFHNFQMWISPQLTTFVRWHPYEKIQLIKLYDNLW